MPNPFIALVTIVTFILYAAGIALGIYILVLLIKLMRRGIEALDLYILEQHKKSDPFQ